MGIDHLPPSSPKPPLSETKPVTEQKETPVTKEQEATPTPVPETQKPSSIGGSRRAMKALGGMETQRLQAEIQAKATAEGAPKLSLDNFIKECQKNDGFAGIWNNQAANYNREVENAKNMNYDRVVDGNKIPGQVPFVSDARKQIEVLMKTPKQGADWERTSTLIQNNWAIFKSNYKHIENLTNNLEPHRNNFANAFTQFFKGNSDLLKKSGFSTPEEAGKAMANIEFEKATGRMREALAPVQKQLDTPPTILPKTPNPNQFNPAQPSNWSALPKLSTDPSKLTPQQKEVQALQREIASGTLTPEQVAVKKGQLFRLIDQGTFSNVDTKVPTFDPATRQGYRAPADSIFTDPKNHTNRWDVSLGLFYNKPGMWTSTGPYAVNATERGLVIARPVEFDDQKALQLAVNGGNEITLGTKEKVSKPSVTATGALSSDFKVTTESGGSITYHVVQGDPYNTALYDKTIPSFLANGGSNIQSVTIDGKTYSWSDLQKMSSLPAGSNIKVTLNNGASWKLYSASPIAFKIEKENAQVKGLTGDKPYTGYLRTACLPANPDYPPGDAAAYEKMLDQYSATVITKGAAGTTQSGYQYAYQCVDMQGKSTANDPLVMLKYPAQEALRQGPTTTTLTYQTVHGPARAVVGSFLQFEVKTPEATILQNVPKFKPDQLPKLREELTAAITAIVNGPDVQTDALYTPAKILQQHATTLKYGMQILKESGMSDAEIQKTLKPLADKIRNEMTKFLGATVQWDSTWGSIVPTSASVQKTIVPDTVKVVADNVVPNAPYEVKLQDALQRLKDVNKDIKIEVGKTINNNPKAGELLLRVVSKEFDPPQPAAKVGQKVTDINNEFGAGSFNDKALQWGYVINSASMLAEYDTAFKTDKPLVNTTIKYKGGEGTVKDVINAICRDIANPSAKDTTFTQNRTIDFYTGQYIASGQTRYGDGRNTESTSEAFNCFVGMAAWGNVTGQKDLRDHAQSLAGMQAAAGKTYYQVDPAKPIYLKNFKDNAIIIANLFDQKMDVNTFFGSLSAMVFGIQGIPANPTSLANTFNPTVLKKAADRLIADWDKIPLAEQHWKSIVLPLIAAVYPDKAEALLAKMKTDKITFDEGTNSFICRFNNLVSLNRVTR